MLYVVWDPWGIIHLNLLKYRETLNAYLYVQKQGRVLVENRLALVKRKENVVSFMRIQGRVQKEYNEKKV